MTDLDNGLVLHLPMNEGSGSKTFDRSKYQNNGTINGATWTTGKIGKALDFDGTDDYVQIPDADSLDIADELSVFLWINTSQVVNYSSPFSKWGNWQGYELYTSSGKLSAMVRDINLNVAQIDQANFVLNDGSWHFIGFTFTRTLLKVYGDGDFITSADSSALTGSIDNTNNVRVGMRNLGGNAFDGIIDEVRVYNRALSAEEIRTLYNERAFSLDNGRVLYLPFNEGSGTKTRDLSLYQNHGTISGASWVTGKIGMGLSFDGSNDDVAISDSNSLDITSQITIAFWMYANDTSGWRTPINKAGTFHSEYLRGAGNKFKWFITFVGGAQTFNSNTNVNDLLGAWHHIVFTYDGSYMRIYIDGKLDAIRAITDILAVNTAILYLGSQNHTDQWFSGKLDEVFIFNRALSAEEIRTLYNMKVKG